MSRRVTVTLNHDLGKEEARRRIADGIGKLQTSMTGGLLFKFVDEWSAADQLKFTARGLGQTIEGVVDIFPQHVRIEAELPGVLAAIAETIAGKMEQNGRLLLEKK